jgi:serine/threonine-protein kinase HSL1 (negative regulator of Swe1 kinase)
MTSKSTSIQHHCIIRSPRNEDLANETLRANDQKLFYSLFLKYRDAQLENYVPDIKYASSDYHHANPAALTKTYSTRQFPQVKSKGHGRQTSRFTVISNTAETEQSYDPFKASRFQHLNAVRGTDRAKITIHPTCPNSIEQNRRIDTPIGTRQMSFASESVVGGSERGRYDMHPTSRGFASYSSLASSTRSRNSGRHVHAPIRYKRGVSFAHIRNRSGSSHAYASGPSAGAYRTSYSGRNLDIDVPQNSPDSTHYIQSRKGQSVVSQPALPYPGTARSSQLWSDDVRQLSSSLAKDCDEAFNPPSEILSTDPQRGNGNTFAHFEPSNLVRHPTTPIRTRPISDSRNARHTSLSNRPLPRPPVRSESVKMELLEARMQAELRKSTGREESAGYLDQMVSHIDRLMDPTSPVATHTDYRASSAPVHGVHTLSSRPLTSILEARKEEESPRRYTEFGRYKDQHQHKESKASRIASAPEPRNLGQYNDLSGAIEFNKRDTIRVVNSPALDEPVQIPAPLKIRKKASQGGRLSEPDSTRAEQDRGGTLTFHRNSNPELHQQYSNEPKLTATPRSSSVEEGDDKFASGSVSGTIVKKKSTWFKRSSKSSDEKEWKMSIGGGHTIPSQSSGIDTVRPQPELLPILPKKKGFNLGKLFKRRPSNTDMTLGGKCIQANGAATAYSLF